MVSARKILPYLSLIFLIGCNGLHELPSPAPVSCTEIFYQIEFSEETKDWLRSLEWPDTAYEDFDKVADHNDVWELENKRTTQEGNK